MNRLSAIRRIIFFGWLGFITLLVGIIFSPIFLFGILGWQKSVIWVSAIWEWWLLLGLRFIVGLTYRITGIEHINQSPYILAIKHQSVFETMLLSLHFPFPAIVLKKELFKIPVYGWYLKAAGNIGIDRKLAGAAMLQVMKNMKKSLAQNRTIVIFPEGTRIPVGNKSKYHEGIYMMSRLGVPVYPVAVNTGLFWTKKKLISGEAEIAILPAMPTGLGRTEFMTELEKRIEAKTEMLCKKPLPK